ncbi:MAG: hypothetical protein ACFFFT_11230 [Candidatus Thorarchaeota archaeon]
MRSVKLLIFLSLIIAFPCIADNSEIFDFSFSFLRSLGHLKVNTEKMDRTNTEVYSNEIDYCIEVMKTLRIQIFELNMAQELLKPYLSSKDSLISEISMTTISNYEDLKLLRIASLKLLEEAYNSENLAIGTTMSQASEIIAQEEEIMKTIMYSSILLTHAIVSYDPDEHGRLSYLKITKRQRQSLIDELVSIWGNEVKNGMMVGQSYLDACGSAIYEFLVGKHKSADERLVK